MKKTSLLLSSCILCALSNSALAAMDIRGERTSFYQRNKPTPIGFNYTYIETNLLYSIVDNGTSSDDTALSLGVKLSFETTQNTSVALKVTGGTYTFNNTFVESNEILLGVNYHYPFTKTLDVYSELNILSINFDDPNNVNNSPSESGAVLAFGIRKRLTPKMELGFSLAAINLADETNAKVRIDYSYGADDETQYTVGIESTDYDNKQNSIFFGIRFNY